MAWNQDQLYEVVYDAEVDRFVFFSGQEAAPTFELHMTPEAAAVVYRTLDAALLARESALGEVIA